MKRKGLILLACTFLSAISLSAQKCDISKCSPEEIAKCCPPTCDITTATPEEMAKCCPWMLEDFDKEAFQTYWESLSPEVRSAFQVASQEKNHSVYFMQNATSPKGHLGVVFQDEMPDNIISEVKLGSAAEQFNLEVGDQIVSIDAIQTNNYNDIVDILANKKAGDEIDVSFLRDGKSMSNIIELRRKQDYTNVEWMYSARVCNPKKVETETRDKVAEPTSPTALSLSSFSASPNPAKDFIQLKFEGEALPTGISIIDINRNIIHRESLPNFSGSYDSIIDLNKARGMVIVSVSQEGLVYSRKIFLTGG